jgi:DNA topoisomerase II
MTTQNKMTVSEFYENEFVDYASYSTIRMIASAIDGMKNVHRKIVNTVIDKKIKDDEKISRLDGVCGSYTEYLHGSMADPIANMAKGFAGTNNLPLMAAEGSFGSRFNHAHSAPRYIFTYGLPIMFKLFSEDDKAILNDQFFEGHKIEPQFYLPSLPLILINGSDGIASGFKQTILSRSEKDVTRYLKGRLTGKIKTKKFNAPPAFNGFTGTVAQGDKDRQWKICGTINRINTTNVEITEIPVGIELSKYLNILDALKEKKVIVSYKDNSDDDVFNFVVKFNRAVLSKLSDEDLLNKLKLIKSETEIYNALDEDLIIKGFKNVGEIFDYYYEVKLSYMAKRKQHLLDKYKTDIEFENSKFIFIKSIVDDVLVINKRKNDAIVKDLDKIDGIITVNDSYNYLLNMGINSLTKERLDKLKASIKLKKDLLKTLKNKTVEEMWLEDLA